MLYDFEVVFVSRYPIAERSKLHLELKLPFQSAAGVVIEIHKFLADIIGTRNATRVAVEFVHRRACEHAPWMQAREMTTWDDRWMLSTGIEHFVEDSDLKAVARVIGASRIIC